MTAVPTMYQGLVSRLGTDGRSPAGRLRLLRSSSASLPPNVAAAIEGLFEAPVIEAYGMTEAAHQIASNPLPPGHRKPGSVGPPAGPAVSILDPSGEPVGCGERGEVAIRGSNVFGGYAANAEANDAAFVDGWFRTGDEGYVDSDGYLVLTGRLKEMINRGGEKIAPREVDEVLLQHPEVKQAVAFAVADERLGEEIAAAVVIETGASCDEATLQLHVAASLADFKVPRRIVFVDEIPRGPTGKLQRIGLAERLAVADLQADRDPVRAPASAGSSPAPGGELAAEVLEVERVRGDDDLFDLGLDSMTAADLLTRAIAAGLAPPGLPTTIFLRHSTPANLAAALEHGALPTGGRVVRPRGRSHAACVRGARERREDRALPRACRGARTGLPRLRVHPPW